MVTVTDTAPIAGQNDEREQKSMNRETYETYSVAEPEKIDLIAFLAEYFQAFQKFFFGVLALVILAGGGSFLTAKLRYQPVYEAYTSFVVGSNRAVGYSYYDNVTAEQLGKTFPYLVTSGVLKDVVARDLGIGAVTSEIQASVMENTNLSNNDGWVDKGYIVTNASDKGLEFNVTAGDWANCYYKWNAIDPSYIITPEGAHWLIYGSWHSGIVAMELNGITGMPKQNLSIPWAEGNAPAEYGQLIATRQAGNRWQASEGPEIIYNPQTEYYYLFMAYDALEIPYNTRVARSKSITGPYLGIDGANVTEGADMYPVVTHPYKFANSDGWVGISHCAIFDDGNGNWYYASQGRLPESVDNAIMLGHVRSIRWTKDGWPLVMPERYGAVPQAAITEEELIGDWEHIDLSYAIGQQKESSIMTLTDDHKVSEGNWRDASWSYDATTQILTINDIDLYLQRETDWEAKPRMHTIVYAAYGNNKTYWGKKANK